MQMRTFGLIVLALACLGVAYYAIATYAGGIPSGMQAGAATPEVLYVHVFASLVALALGPLQFAASLRARHPRLHRNSGRLYLLGVFVGGGAGLLLAFFAQGAWVAKAGFAALAVCWLHTAIRALVAILAGDVVAHRRWMVRNFALTFAAVTLRLYLPAAMVSGVPFEAAYPAIAWLCWVPNLLAAEALFNRTGPRLAGRDGDRARGRITAARGSATQRATPPTGTSPRSSRRP